MVPIHDAGHYVLSSRLFLGLLGGSKPGIERSKTNAADVQIDELFQKLLLLQHHYRPSGDNHDDCSDCLPVLALAYLRYHVLRNDILAARRVYTRVLFESNYVVQERMASRKQRELDATLELSEASIAMEVGMGDGGGLEKRGGSGGGWRGTVGRLYDGMVSVLEGREEFKVAEVFRKRKLEDLA